jgi:hypothetical protein
MEMGNDYQFDGDLEKVIESTKPPEKAFDVHAGSLDYQLLVSVSEEQLDAHSVYPQRGVTACKIVQRFLDAAGGK